MKRKAGMPMDIPVSLGRSNGDEAHFANSLMWHLIGLRLNSPSQNSWIHRFMNSQTHLYGCDELLD